jgi:hypothetical protein
MSRKAITLELTDAQETVLRQTLARLQELEELADVAGGRPARAGAEARTTRGNLGQVAFLLGVVNHLPAITWRKNATQGRHFQAPRPWQIGRNGKTGILI